MRRLRTALLSVSLAVALGTAVQLLLARGLARRPSEVELLLQAEAVPARIVRVLVLGFASAAADLNYLEAIQVFGDTAHTRATGAARERRNRAIARLLERTTDLDPRFDFAYIFAGMSIPTLTADGDVQNLEEATRLLEKGVRNGGSDWRIPFHLAFLRGAYAQDYARAATAMAEAARRPGHPTYLPFLATRLAAHGGEVDTGLALARSMLEHSETDEQREQLVARIKLLEMERDLRALEAAVAAYRARRGVVPTDVAALAADGLLPAVPVEPHGGRYEIEPGTGAVRSTGATRLRLSRSALEQLKPKPVPPPAPTP